MKRTWQDLLQTALSPAAVGDEPLIPFSRPPHARAPDARPEPELRGDILARGFGEANDITIFDVRITDPDAPSQRNSDVTRLLQKHEDEKERRYRARCMAARQRFVPLVYTIDGVAALQARAAATTVAKLLATKWQQPERVVEWYVQVRLSLALIRGTSMCLRATRTAPLRLRRPTWEGGAALALF